MLENEVASAGEAGGMPENKPATTQDERVIAAMAHGAAIIPFMGLVAAIVIWATQREKSAYVRFQALQAVAYQVSMVVLMFLAMGCYMCSFFGMFLLIPLSEASSIGAAEGIFAMLGVFSPFLIFGVFMLLQLALIVYGIIGAVRTLQGMDFEYIVIGKRVRQYIG